MRVLAAIRDTILDAILDAIKKITAFQWLSLLDFKFVISNVH